MSHSSAGFAVQKDDTNTGIGTSTVPKSISSSPARPPQEEASSREVGTPGLLSSLIKRTEPQDMTAADGGPSQLSQEAVLLCGTGSHLHEKVKNDEHRKGAAVAPRQKISEAAGNVGQLLVRMKSKVRQQGLLNILARCLTERRRSRVKGMDVQQDKAADSIVGPQDSVAGDAGPLQAKKKIEPQTAAAGEPSPEQCATSWSRYRYRS